jgi:murein DD-endopeptidase MepM/ murein hydrolase activator NlpD
LSRTSVPGLLYLLVESMVREVLGAGRVVGNHIVVDQGDGRYAMYAHLQRHSATVRPGDRVTAGQQIARCGNSGNSTEPHLHFQIMDGPRPAFAAGLPFTFTGGPVPRTGELLDQATSSADSRSIVSPTSRA